METRTTKYRSARRITILTAILALILPVARSQQVDRRGGEGVIPQPSQETQFDPHNDWRCTTKPGKLHIHIFQRPAGGKFTLPAVKGKVAKAYLLTDPNRAALDFRQTGSAVSLTLPSHTPDKTATVVCLETIQ